MLSCASLAAAFPGRGSITRTSSVLSQIARFGQNPMPPLYVATALSFPNSHRFASRCARPRLQRTGWLAADARGAFEAVAVDGAGKGAGEAGVAHAESCGRQLWVPGGGPLGHPGLAADAGEGRREWPAGEAQCPLRIVRVAGGQAADLGAGSGVQQREQAGESLMRVSRAARPSPEQRPLGGGVKDGAGKGRLAAQPEGGGWVDEDELAVFRPAEEAAQHVGLLVAVAGAVAEESFEVGGGDLGPTGHRPGGCEVGGQVSEDTAAGLQGGIALRVTSGAPGTIMFCELAVVEGGDRGGQAVWNGVEMTAPPCRRTALFLVSGQCQAAAGEECAQGPPGCPGGRCAAVQQLLRAGIRVGAEQPSGLTQDDDRAARVMARRGEGGEVVPPGRDRAQAIVLAGLPGTVPRSQIAQTPDSPRCRSWSQFGQRRFSAARVTLR